MQNEPDNFLRPGSEGRERSLDFAHAQLVVSSDRGEFLPRLAEEIPSLERRTWTIAPDGSMQVTWTLRPNIKWHDGQPLTADDLVFVWEYLSHPRAIVSQPAWFSSLERVTATDARTLVFHFKRLYALAIDIVEIRPMPRHVLGATLAAGDIDAFNNSPLWRDEFIGAGPYRVVEWEPGSRIEFARFDDFFLGRPPLDSVVMTFFPSLNTLMANILAGEIDLHLPSGLEAVQAVELKRRWEGTGNQVLAGSGGRLRVLAFQFRPETLGLAALGDRAVRQALFRGLDREGIAETNTLGLGPISDSWAPPDDPGRQMPEFRDSIIQYPYDPARAERELQALGWRRGADGVLVNPAGVRFAWEVRDSPSAGAENTLSVLGDGYKRMGVSVVQTIMTPQRAADREYRSLYPGAEITSNRYTEYDKQRLHSTDIAAPANRYAGGNKGGYSHPEMDQILDRLALTIPVDDRNRMRAEVLKLGTTDLPVLPIYWSIAVITASARVKNLHAPSPLALESWNLPEWDLA